jgi:hypothetical protein
MNWVLEVEPMDVGEDVKAVSVELVESDEAREPARGKEAAHVWARVLPAIAGEEPWGLDFFSHLERVREYYSGHNIRWREASGRSIVVTVRDEEDIAGLFERFEAETFGVRAGKRFVEGDSAVEQELARRGVDAYHKSFPDYFFCGVCEFEDASLALLSTKLWASEVIRRVKPALKGMEVTVRLPA